jgi:hypothetical protein
MKVLKSIKMKIKTLIIALIVAINLQAQLTWSSAAEMNFSRNGHTMTGLQDGFLVTGGYDGFENLKSAELFIAGSTYDWVLVGDMDSIRFEHKATRYEHAGAEKVLISGGWNGGSINYYGTQIYDATSQSFSDGPDMSVGRSGHTSTQLNDGRILLVGGYSSAGGNTTIVEIFDPATETISQVASLQTGRSYHTATLLNDGRVLVAGGFNPDAGFQINSCEIYDPMLDTWTTVGSWCQGEGFLMVPALMDIQLVKCITFPQIAGRQRLFYLKVRAIIRCSILLQPVQILIARALIGSYYLEVPMSLGSE